MVLLYIFIAIIAFILLVLGVGKLLLWMSESMLYNSIEVKYQDAEFISETHQIPPEWRKKKNRQNSVTDFMYGGGGSIQIPKSEWRKHIRRLKKLIRHFKNTQIISDEATRRLILSGLENAKKEWVSESRKK